MQTLGDLFYIFHTEIAERIDADDLCDLIDRMLRRDQIFAGIDVGTVIARVQKRRCRDTHVDLLRAFLAQAEELAEMLRGVDGVKDVEFEKDTHHYNSASALFEVTFDGEKLDEISIQGVKNVRAALDGYDTYITTEIGNPTGEILEREMRIVLIILMCSIFVVLLLTSHTYAEGPVLIITFAVAVWVNNRTHYMIHEVSFITNSIAAVLQLGLGIDYAIIMCHHYTEERERMEPREATIRALTLAIPEISASSLTTISGLLALSFMMIKFAEDMSLVLV